MPQITLENIFRYYCSVTVFGICLALIYPETAKDLLSTSEKLGGAATSTILVIGGWVVGSLFYFLYRALMYDYVISPLLDLTNSALLGTQNYRLWLQERYSVSSCDAEKLYAVIRTSVPSLVMPSIIERSALIHMSYQAGIICLTMGAYARCLQLPIYQPLLVFGVLCLFGAFVADIRIEHQVRMTLEASKEQIHKIAYKAVRGAKLS